MSDKFNLDDIEDLTNYDKNALINIIHVQQKEHSRVHHSLKALLKELDEYKGDLKKFKENYTGWKDVVEQLNLYKDEVVRLENILKENNIEFTSQISTR